MQKLLPKIVLLERRQKKSSDTLTKNSKLIDNDFHRHFLIFYCRSLQNLLAPQQGFGKTRKWLRFAHIIKKSSKNIQNVEKKYARGRQHSAAAAAFLRGCYFVDSKLLKETPHIVVIGKSRFWTFSFIKHKAIVCTNAISRHVRRDLSTRDRIFS